MNESEYLDFLENVKGSNISEKVKNMPGVDLELANGQLYKEKGKIEAVTGQIDPNTGSVQFRAGFENKDGLLSNGNSGKIRIPRKYENALVIPESAAYEQQGEIYTYTVVQDTVRSVKIKLLDRIDNLAIISSGIKKGDKVVASPANNLKSGTFIKPQPASIDSIVNKLKPIF
jgi:membrane fusion protein, multidrug efflux system